MEPQLAIAVKPDKLHRYAHYVMEPKLDGIRCIAYKDIVGIVRLTSRGGKDLTAKVPHIVETLEHTLRQGMYLDGELGYNIADQNYCPILDFNKTTRVLGSGVDVAIEKQTSELEDSGIQIQYFVFDTPRLESVEDSMRRKHLEYWYLQHYRRMYDPPVVIVPRMDAFDQAWYDNYVLMGGEGVMLKNPDALYDPGGRHANNWYKLKKFDTTEGMIVDMKEGQGKYVGMCGAIQIRLPNGTYFWCAGMDDGWRERFWEGQAYWGAKHVEVKHFGFTAGTPRFPQFLRMRPDLDHWKEDNGTTRVD